MERMEDFEKELEESYKQIGDGGVEPDALDTWEYMEQNLQRKTVMEVKITGVVSKGLIADIDGIRAFIPVSKIDTKRVEDLNPYLGKVLRVIVITADREARRLVLSARDVKYMEEQQKRTEKIDQIEVGSVVTGVVDSIKDYGAFIQLEDGISGLVHISQISTERIKHPKAVLKEGQEVTAKVIGNENGRISLSIKALQVAKEQEEEINVTIPKSEDIGTSLGDLLKGIKL